MPVGTALLFPPYDSELFPSPMGEGARRAGEDLPVGKIQVGPGWGAIFVIAGFFT